MLLGLLFQGVSAGSDEKIPQKVVNQVRMGIFNQKFYELTSTYYSNLPVFSSLPAETSQDDLDNSLPVSTLEEVYERTRIKHLSGISFWSTLEKYETCKILREMESRKVEDIYLASMATTFLPTSFLVLGKCAFIASEEQKLSVKFAIRQKNSPENLARIMSLLDLWEDKTLNFPTGPTLEDDVKDNLHILQAFFRHRDADMFKYTRIFGEPAFATLMKTLTRRRGEAFYKDVHTTLLALEGVQIIKKRTGEDLFDQELLKEFGRNLMTKFSLLNSEIEDEKEPNAALKSKLFSTLASMSILADLKPDAMKNPLSGDEINLPMDFFSVKHYDLPKSLHEIVGKEYKDAEEIEKEMNAKLDAMIRNKQHDEL